MDFKAMINKAREEGMSLDDIENEFSQAFDSAAPANNDFYDDLEHEFWQSVAEEEFDFHDVATLAALVALDIHDDWDKKTTERYIDLIEKSLEDTANIVSMKPREAVNNLINELFDLLGAN
jgi:hypothetical protein